MRQLVSHIEQAVIDLLSNYGLQAATRQDAPGVYVDGQKIAALGLRIRRGCCYHGLSLNVSMDLEPFKRINPCGYPGLEVTQLSDLGSNADINTVTQGLLRQLTAQLGYNTIVKIDELQPLIVP